MPRVVTNDRFITGFPVVPDHLAPSTVPVDVVEEVHAAGRVTTMTYSTAGAPPRALAAAMFMSVPRWRRCRAPTLIVRHGRNSDILNRMKVMTASEVSRAFSAVLDEAEHGETIVITRAGRRVATITAANAATWGSLRSALADWIPPADPDLEDDMRAARAAVTLDEDTWQSA